MIIKGTQKIKGVVDIASIKLQLKKDSVYAISDNDYWNSDVQSALRMGFIEASTDKTTSGETRHYECVNVYHRELTLPFMTLPVKPNGKFSLNQKEINDPSVRAAQARGMIKVVEVVDGSDRTEGTMKLGNVFKSTENINPNVVEAQPPVVLETNEDLPRMTEVVADDRPRQVDPLTLKRNNMVSWNPTGESPITTVKGAVVSLGQNIHVKSGTKAGSLMDALRTTDEVIASTPTTELVNGEERQLEISSTGQPGKIPTNVSDNPNPLPVNPLLSDQKKNTVVVNPNCEKIGDTPKSSIVWDGRHPTASSASKTDSIFIDEEVELERIKKHPKLQNKATETKVENDPIAPDSLDKTRIAQHPILKKTAEVKDEDIPWVDEKEDEERMAKHPVLGKKRQNEEINFG